MGLTLNLNQWYHLEYTCNGTVGIWRELTQEVQVPGTAITTPLSHFKFEVITTAAATYYVDDIAFGVVEVSAVSPIDTFCSDPTIADFGGDARADFGYNYVDSTDAFDEEDATQAGFSDGYIMESDDSGGNDPASLGKGWAGDVYTAEVWLRIDAATEGKESNFRAVFSFDAAVPSTSSVGNARTTGSFQDHVAVRLKETGNDWRINLEFVTGGTGPTQVGGAYIGLDPNSPQTFIFRVDTRAADPYFAVRNLEGVDILNETLDQVVGGIDLGAKVDNKLYAQWFVSEGGSATLGNAFTYLDDNDQSTPYNSTCIFLGEGGSFSGHPGGIPGSTVGDVDEDVETAGTGAFALSPAQCTTFGSCRAAQGFQGMIALVTGAGISGVGAVGAAAKLKLKIDLRVIVAVAGAGGFVAVMTMFFLDIVADWFFYVTIVALLAFLVFMGFRAIGAETE